MALLRPLVPQHRLPWVQQQRRDTLAVLAGYMAVVSYWQCFPPFLMPTRATMPSRSSHVTICRRHQQHQDVCKGAVFHLLAAVSRAGMRNASLNPNFLEPDKFEEMRGEVYFKRWVTLAASLLCRDAASRTLPLVTNFVTDLEQSLPTRAFSFPPGMDSGTTTPEPPDDKRGEVIEFVVASAVLTVFFCRLPCQIDVYLVVDRLPA